MSQIKTTYRGIEISYCESKNDWSCDLFSKPAETLASAKERIDKKLDCEKKKPFCRFPAFVSSFGFSGERWPLVEVTSVTDSGQEAWVTFNGERRKVGSSFGRSTAPIFPATPENTALVAEIHELFAKKKEIEDKIEAATEALVIWKPDNSQ